MQIWRLLCYPVTPPTHELGALGRIRTCVSRFRKPEPDPLDYESKFGGATGNRTQATAVQTQRATIITMTPKSCWMITTRGASSDIAREGSIFQLRQDLVLLPGIEPGVSSMSRKRVTNPPKKQMSYRFRWRPRYDEHARAIKLSRTG